MRIAELDISPTVRVCCTRLEASYLRLWRESLETQPYSVETLTNFQCFVPFSMAGSGILEDPTGRSKEDLVTTSTGWANSGVSDTKHARRTHHNTNHQSKPLCISLWRHMETYGDISFSFVTDLHCHTCRPRESIVDRKPQGTAV